MHLQNAGGNTEAMKISYDHKNKTLSGITLYLDGEEYKSVQVPTDENPTGNYKWGCNACEFRYGAADQTKGCLDNYRINEAGGPDCYYNGESLVWVKSKNYVRVITLVAASRLTGQGPDEEELEKLYE